MQRRLPLLTVVLLAARAFADDAPPETPPPPQLTKPPVLKRFIDAPYPPDAEREHLAGAVLLEIDISADGRVTNATVLESAGHGFDEAARDAILQFEFDPAELDGKPGPVRVTYRYEFVLRPAALEPAKTEAPNVVTLEGQVLERGVRQPVRSALAFADQASAHAEAAVDDTGHFAFRDLAPGVWKLSILAGNFDRFDTTEEVRAGEVTTVRYFIRRRTGEFETVVRAKREAKEVARRTVTLEEIKKIPGTQGDAIRIVQNLPGVARTPLGLGPLVIRGGRPGDTRTYIDGQIVPLLFHFGGLTSVINSDFLDTLDFYPGNFPVRYGRSIAGAVDVNTRPAKGDRLHGYASVSITESSLFVEAPIGDVGAIAASVRRSYIDTVLPIVGLFVDLSGFNISLIRYWDYQLKADFNIAKNKLSFFLFGSDDQLGVATVGFNSVAGEGRNDLFTHISFHRLTARWERKLADGFDHRLSVTLGTDNTLNRLGQDLYGNLGLDSLAVREDLTYRVNDSLTFQGGLDLLVANFSFALQTPRPPPPGEFFNPLINDDLVVIKDTGSAAQPAFWLDAVWKPLDHLKLVPGVRIDFDTYLDLAWFDPRFAAFFEFDDATVLKGSVGRYHQPPTPDKVLPVYGNPHLKEEGSDQIAGGIEHRFEGLFDVDFQLYWKSLYDEATRSQQLQTAAARDRTGGAQVLNTGTGEAYGIELLVRRPPGGRFFGWLAVSLAQTYRRAAPGEALEQSFLNQRFNVIGVGTWKLPWWQLEAGTRVRLVDGNPNTPFSGALFDSDADVSLPIPGGARRTERLPVFFQIDVRVDRRFVFEQWIFDAFLEVQNVLNYPNIEGYTPNYDFSLRRSTTGLPIFPFFGVRAEL